MERSNLPPPLASGMKLVKTALHQAVLDQRLHQVRLLVARHGVRVDSRDVHGRTPLMLACMVDHEELGLKMAAILMKAGAYLNVRDALGRTALSYACLNGRQEIVRSILKEDVLDVNEPDNDGNTPMHHAAVSGKPDIVRMLAEILVRFGLNPDRRNKLGYTALLLACKCGHFVSAYTLLTATKASPTLRDGEIHLSASEWVRRRHRFQVNVERALLSSAPASQPAPHTLSFSREYTMYQPSLAAHSASGERLSKSEQSPRSVVSVHTMTCSPDALRIGRLPPIIQTPRKDEAVPSGEAFLQGREARQALLDEITEIETQLRPESPRAHGRGRLSHPPTAKLRAFASRSYKGVPHDVVAIFRAYSDQYRPPSHRRRPHDSGTDGPLRTSRPEITLDNGLSAAASAMVAA